MEPTDHLLAEARRYGYVENDGVWLRPVLGQPARQIGVVKKSEEAALSYFAQRFEALRAKVDDTLANMETAENSGSFLMKALHLKEQLLTYEGLGDFASLHQRLTDAEEAQSVTIRQNREKNLAAKIAFIEEAEALQDSVEWVTASEKVKDLRQGWLKTGPVDKGLTDTLETRFQNAVQTFFDRRKAFQSDKKAMANRVVTRYRDLIAQAEKLKVSDQFETASRQLKLLQQAWREVNGSLPKKQAAELWTRFRAANNFFFERLKVHIQTQQATGVIPSANASQDELLARKRRLAERAEALMNTPPQEAINQAKALQAEWKQVGTVRGEESDRIWQRFMVACDKIFELSALEYYLRKLPGGEPAGTPAERARFRAATLRELLKGDHQELAVVQDNLDKLSSAPANDAFRQMLQTKVRSFERKIRTKNDLIVIFSQQAQVVS
jgi:hypothetical protein